MVSKVSSVGMVFASAADGILDRFRGTSCQPKAVMGDSFDILMLLMLLLF